MNLATAGMISGMGNAGTQALSTAQSVFGSVQLQAERDKMEAARLQLHEDYAMGREQRNQTFETGRDQARIGADIAKTSLVQQGEAAEKEKDRTLKREEATTNKTLKEQELSNQAKHYGDLATYYNRAGVQAKDVPDSVKEGVSLMDNQITNLHKSARDPLTDPEQAKRDLKKAEALTRKSLNALATRSLAPLFEEDGQDSSTPYQITSPFPLPGQGSVPKNGMIGQAKDAQTSSGEQPVEAATVIPTRPVLNPRGRQDPAQVSKVRKQQLDYDVLTARQALEQAKVHGNKERIQALQDQLDTLEAQQEASGELTASGRQ